MGVGGLALPFARGAGLQASRGIRRVATEVSATARRTCVAGPLTHSRRYLPPRQNVCATSDRSYAPGPATDVADERRHWARPILSCQHAPCCFVTSGTRSYPGPPAPFPADPPRAARGKRVRPPPTLVLSPPVGPRCSPRATQAVAFYRNANVWRFRSCPTPTMGRVQLFARPDAMPLL